MKKPENANAKNNNNIEELKIDNYCVKRAITVGKNASVLADVEINGITIYGMRVVEGKNGDFLSFPQTKGKDGKYYSVCWAKLSDKDQADILKAIEDKLNGWMHVTDTELAELPFY